MIKAFNEDDEEIEVYTADDIKAAAEDATKKKDLEWAPKITALEGELALAKKSIGDRAGEFKQFRELHQDVVAKLSVAERTIYENQLAVEKRRVEDETRNKTALEVARDNAIRAKAGTDEKIFTKMKDMWNIIGIQANTVEEIENKIKMVLGAISTTEPNLLASVAGFTGGSFKPPESEQEKEKSFADTEKGKMGMDELGLKIPVEEKKK